MSVLLKLVCLQLLVFSVNCVRVVYNSPSPASHASTNSNPMYPNDSQYNPVRVPQRQYSQRVDTSEKEEEHFDLDYYLIVNEAFERNINDIKNSINGSKAEIVKKMDSFPKKLLGEANEFNIIINKYNGSNCKYDNCTLVKCKQHLPDQVSYANSFEIFAKLLVLEFDKNIHSLEEQMISLESTINVTKKMIMFKRAKAFFKKSAAEEIKEWERETIIKLYDLYYRLWKNIVSLTERITTLGQREEELEEKIIEEIKEKLQKFACCTKEFNFQISGLYC